MRVFISLGLAFMMTCAVAQTKVLDSLKMELNHHQHQDTVRVNLLNSLSYHYRWMDFSRAQREAEEALRLANTLHFSKGIAVADCRLAHCLWAIGDNELAIEKGLEAAGIAEQLHSAVLLGESFQVIARGYMDQRETKKAQAYIQKAELVSFQTTDWDLQSRVYNLAGVILFVKGKTDSALVMYEKALSIVKSRATSQAQLSQIMSNIGECYVNSDIDLGLKYFRDALRISKEERTKNRSAEAAVSGVIGNALTRKKQYQEAEIYLQECLKIARELGSKRSVRYAYARLANLKMLQGKSVEALEYQKKYYEVNDSLVNVTKTRKIVELESKYELEKKEHAIQLLERDHELQKLWTNIWITAFVLVGILSAVLYYLQEFRDQKNRTILNLEIDQLMTQNKELSEKYKAILSGTENQTIESSDQRLLKKAIEVIETNISDPVFGVEQMASALSMSRTNMHRKIKAITGFPPSELIRNIRLRKAATLLMKKADSVSQISYSVGFEDHSYFSKSFKKQFGVSPSEYVQSKDQLN
jgi:AraC-like DNA-binding protein